MDALKLSEQALKDEKLGQNRIGLQRRIVRLAKPPRRFKAPVFDNFPPPEPQILHLNGTVIVSEVGHKNRYLCESGLCSVEVTIKQIR